ncbi:GTPase HflX [Glaciimonas immobilis]|uniref:GTPase HflX n=1 Tax=Glaciimonas immobilis TaxID=728004 RepID=A0A840RND7_9BURK|nr:GTPase HflX [Glaciimonas immobilis]KAF3998859.1 GTPase HflX [Glaciimonas immobilis]MBB5198254.1 GTP-binding protein HflX [Glaciimonas immobilis]
MRAALVGVDFGKGDFAASLEELSLLAKSAGAVPIVTITGRRGAPDAALFVGSGKAQEIADAVLDDDIEIIIFNHALSPAQQRNLERVLKVRVLDRTSLILDIFAQRAKSHEGKVQVELAQLQHLATRLIRGWTHLERQKGGIGLRGPGETQLETDRRLLGDRVKALRGRLEKLHRQHATQRRARGRSNIPSISLVGYTNAGKSTLFNALSKAGVYAADQLFATLDTTSRKIYLGEGANVVISDTVGFIRELPHQLVAAFRATLEETIHADLLLHVVDAASPARLEQIEQVNLVLKEIGADHIPQILVWNKIDAAELSPGIERNEYDKIQRVFISAQTGAGLGLMRQAITEFVTDNNAARVDQQQNENTQSIEDSQIKRL